MDLDPVLLEALELTQVAERLVQLLALLDDDRRLLDRDRGWRLDPVEDEGVRALLDVVEDVVEAADEGVNVLAIERRDERRLEPPADLVAQLVAAMLGVADLAGPLQRRVIRPEHRLEKTSRTEDVRGVLLEHVEEAFLAWDQAQSHVDRVAPLQRRAQRRLCDARPVDTVVVTAFVAILAIALAASLALAWSRGRQLDDVRDALRAALGSASAPTPSAGTGTAGDAADDVRRLRQRAETAEFALGQRLRDLAYLADLVGVGIVRLTDDLQVEVANVAAHVFLGREPGSMVGRSAIEALVDHRIEAVARRARDVGSASEEVEPRGPDAATLIVRARRSPILGVWLVLQDVAELRRLQRIRAEFVDNLSHELRTPITTIGLLTETLARDADAADAGGAPLPPRMKDRIGKLEIEIANVGQMIA